MMGDETTYFQSESALSCLDVGTATGRQEELASKVGAPEIPRREDEPTRKRVVL